MDRERLKQVQQTDLTESRVNRDLVDWLRDKGLTYLLIFLLVLVAFVLYHRWSESRETSRSRAYADLDTASQALTLELVADENAGVGAVPDLARIEAGTRYLLMAQTGFDMDSREDLSEEQVADRLAKASRLFERVLADTTDAPSDALVRAIAHFGLAAIAENTENRDLDAAKRHYEQIIALTESNYPAHAARARARLATIDSLRDFSGLPSSKDLPARRFLDPELEDLFLPHLEETPAEEGS